MNLYKLPCLSHIASEFARNMFADSVMLVIATLAISVNLGTGNDCYLTAKRHNIESVAPHPLLKKGSFHRCLCVSVKMPVLSGM